MRRATVHSILLAIVVVSSVWLHSFPHAYALPSYAPGVKAGDSITYGNFSVNNTTPYPYFQANISNIMVLIRSVDAATNAVVASLITTYRNGSQITNSLNGTTDTQVGNLLPYIVAGGLSAGDLLWKSSNPYYPISVNETVNKVYAGALRTVNLLNLTFQSSYQSVRASYYWDVKTGLLLEEYVNQSYVSSNGVEVLQIYFEATATNVWTPQSSPDFALDASAQTSGPHLGETTSYRLDLRSLNSFNGTIDLLLSLLGPVPAHPPSIALSSPTVSVSSQNPTASSILTFSTNSTTSLGQFLIGINATSGTVFHQAMIAVDVAPPDYTITANPSNLTLPQGTSKNSTITVKSLGAFTGTVTLQAFPQFFNSPLTVLLSTNTIELNSTNPQGTAILTVKAPPGAPPGIGGVNINGVSGNIYRSTFVAVNVTGPDFRIIASPTFLTFKEGQSATSTITLTSILGFTGTVSLSASTYGPVTATLASNSLNLTAGGKVSTNVTLSTPATGPPGIYSVYVSAASGIIQHSVYLSLNVTGPDFRFIASVYSVTLLAGQSTNATLTLTGVGGFSGTINLSTNTYGPVSASVNPNSLSLNSTRPSSTALLTVLVPAGTLPGYYSVTINAVSASIVHNIYFSVQVIGPDFYVSANPGFLSLPQGGSGQSTISVSSLNSFSGNVFLSANIYPQLSLQVSLSSAVLALSAGGVANSTLTIQVPLNTSPGYYFVNVVASSDQLTRSYGVEVQVTGPDFSIFSSPNFLTIRQGASANSTITLTSIDNFISPVNITASTYYPSLVSVSPKSLILVPARNATLTTTLTFSAPSNTPPGVYYFQIVASSGNLTRTTFVDVDVTGPDFNISVNPSSLSLSPGTSGITTITLSSIEGFSGNVTLSASAFALNATFANSVVQLSSNGVASDQATIRVPASVFSGNYQVQITASSGILTRFAYVIVQVVAPDFSFQADQSSIFVSGGGSAQSTFTLRSLNGFNGTVTLSTTPFLPAGVTAALNESSVTLLQGGSAFVALNVTASGSVPSQTFYLQVQATGGNLTRYAYVFVTITSPDFTLTANPAFLSLPRGSSSSTALTTTGVGGFHGNVTLTVSGNFGLSVSLAPMAVDLSSGGSATSTVSVAAPSTTPPGNYVIIVTGTSGEITRTSFIEVQVTGTSFTLGANPSFLVLNPGTSSSSTIQVSTFNGFVGTVQLSAVLHGLNATLNPQSVVLNATVTSAVATVSFSVPAHTISGYYGVSVTGSGDGFNATANVTVFVNAFDFVLQAQPVSVTVFQGGLNTSTVSVSTVDSFNGTISLNALVFSPDAGVTASISPAILFVSSNHTETSTVTVSASDTASTGSYGVEINAVGTPAVGSPIVHSLVVSVTVAPKPDFQLSADSSYLSLVQDDSAMSTLSLTGMNLFAGSVSLSATVSLQGLSVSLLDSSMLVAGNLTAHTSLIVSAGTNVVGYFTITVTAQGGGVVHSIIIQVYVAAKPDFTLSASPSSLTIQAGSSGSTVMSLASLNGFVGPVQIFPQVSAAGVSFAPNVSTASLSAGGTASMTITIEVGITASSGTYMVTFIGNATTGSHSTSLLLTVLPPPDFTLTPSTLGLTFAAGTSASLNIAISPTNGFNGAVALSSNAPSGFTSTFSPNPVLGGSGTSNLTLSVSSTVAVGNYAVIVTGIGGSFSHTASIHVTVSAASKVTLTVSQVSWTHRLSLSKSGGMETWTMLVKNTGTVPAYFQIATAGNSTSSAQSFSVNTPVAVLAPGASMTITLSQPFTNASIGLKDSFAVSLMYGSGIYASGSIISPSTILVTKGTFSIVR